MRRFSVQPLGRDIEIEETRAALASGRCLKLVGEPGSGRATVALAALARFDPVVVRIPWRAHEIPLGAARRVLDSLHAGKGRLEKNAPVYAAWSDISEGAARMGSRIFEALPSLGGRPLVILDFDRADPLSLRAIEGAWSESGRRAPPLRKRDLLSPEGTGFPAPPLVVTLADSRALGLGETLGIGPMPALACHELLKTWGASDEDCVRLAARSMGNPLKLRLEYALRAATFSGDVIHKAVTEMSQARRIAAAATAWGFTIPATAPRFPWGDKTPGVVAETALSSLNAMERRTLRRILSRSSHGFAAAWHETRRESRALSRAGKAFLAHGHAAVAADILERSCEEEAGDSKTRLDLARAYIGTGRWSDAEKIIREILQESPSRRLTSQAHVVRSILLRRSGRPDGAKKELALVEAGKPEDLAASPKNAVLVAAANETAILLAEENRPGAAKKIFQKILRSKHNRSLHITAAGNLAFLEARLGRANAAQKAFATAERIARALGQDEDLAIVFLNRSFLEVQARQWKRAASFAADAARLAGLSGLLETELRARQNRAEALLALKRFDEALEEAEKALGIFGTLKGATDAAIWAFMVKAAALKRIGEGRAGRRACLSAAALAKASKLQDVCREAEETIFG